MGKRILREWRYDIRSLGFEFYAPAVFLGFLVAVNLVLLLLMRIRMGGEMYTFLFLTLQVYMPASAVIWSAALMRDVFETPGGDLFLTYHRSRRYWGVRRQLRGFAVSAVCVAVVDGFFSLYTRQSFFPAQFLLHLGQGFFIMGLSFLAFALSGKTVIAYAVPAVYICCVRILGKPNLSSLFAYPIIQSISIYSSQEYEAVNMMEALPMLIRCGAGGLAFFLIGQFIVELKN